MFSLAVLIAGCTSLQVDDRPNIIFIMVDDLGKEWVSCYGADSIETPHVDALAASGMQFDHVYAMPQCTPTRLTFLTGQYPFRHGWVNHWDVPRWGGGAHYDETTNPCLPREIKKLGYRTCIAGKWQIDDFRVEPDALSRIGFDQYLMWTGGEGGNPQSNERYHSPYVFSDTGARTISDEFGPDLFTDFICQFIEDNADQPMFIYYPMVLTHTPFIVPPGKQGFTQKEKHRAMVEYADKLTGQIVDAVDHAGIRDNTLIVWTTDNGTTRQITGSLRGQPVRGGKSLTAESGICVPFVASWPANISAGTTTDALVDFTDLYPTFLELCGSTHFTDFDSESQIDGYSFVRAMKGEESPRTWIMSMGGGNNARRTDQGIENQYRYRDRVIRNERYKLYVDSFGRAAQFFDLKMDLYEKQNIIDQLSTEQNDVMEQLSAVIKNQPNLDNDPRYIPNPAQPWDVEITAESEIWKR